MKNIIKLLSVVCSVLILSGCVLVVNAATTATEPVSQNVTIPEDYQLPDTNVDGSDSNVSVPSNKDLKIEIDPKTNNVDVNWDTLCFLNENDVLNNWNSKKSVLDNIDFSNLGQSVSSFDANDSVLNFQFALLASSLNTYQENTSLNKVDKNADIFEKGYSENITQYFESSFGDLSSKKDLSLDELPSMSSYTKQADKKRNSGMKSFLNSSTYKYVNSMVNVGDIFSSAKTQLNGGGTYSLPSISSIRSSIAGEASALDAQAKSNQSQDFKSNAGQIKQNYNQHKSDKMNVHYDEYNAYKTEIANALSNITGQEKTGSKKTTVGHSNNGEPTDGELGVEIGNNLKDWGIYRGIIGGLGEKASEEYGKNGVKGLTNYIANHKSDFNKKLTYLEKHGGPDAKKIYNQKGLTGLAQYMTDNDLCFDY